MSATKVSKRAGFIKIEAIVVMLMIAVVMSLTAPAIQAARQGDARTATAANLKQNAVAVHNALDQNKTIPPYFGTYGGKKDATFHVHLLPFLEQIGLWNDPKDGKAVVPPYVSEMDPTHADKGAGAANFPINLRLSYTNGGLGELATGDKVIKLKFGQFTDGTSNTVLFATKYQSCGKDGGSLWLDPGKNAADSPTAATFGASMKLWQQAPAKDKCDPKAGTAVSFNDKLMLIALMDSSVRTVAVGMSEGTWQAAQTYGAMDTLGVDWQE